MADLRLQNRVLGELHRYRRRHGRGWMPTRDVSRAADAPPARVVAVLRALEQRGYVLSSWANREIDNGRRRCMYWRLRWDAE